LSAALDGMATRYGVPPHTWLLVDDVLTAFDYEVFTKATAR